MFKSLTLFSLLLSIGFATAFCQSNKTNEVVKSEANQITDNLFKVNLPIENKASKTLDASFNLELQIERMLVNDQYYLAATIELPDGSYVVSPYSKDDFYMYFDIVLNAAENLLVKDSLLEIPTSVEELDTIINKKVRFVRENTTFKKKVIAASKEDFEVAGKVEFLLEPICIPYIVDFVISQRAGIMEVKKTNTRTHPSYKGR